MPECRGLEALDWNIWVRSVKRKRKMAAHMLQMMTGLTITLAKTMTMMKMMMMMVVVVVMIMMMMMMMIMMMMMLLATTMLAKRTPVK